MPRNEVIARLQNVLPVVRPADQLASTERHKPQGTTAAAGPPCKGVRYEMRGFMEQCVEKFSELTGINAKTFLLVATPCVDDHTIPPEEWEEKGELALVAAHVLMKILYDARMYRYDLQFSVCSLAREVTRCCKACDRKLLRLVSYINATKDLVLESAVGDHLRDCRLVLYSDADFAGNLRTSNLRTSKSTSGIFLAWLDRVHLRPLLL